MTVSSSLQDGKTDHFEGDRSQLIHAFLKAQGLENETLTPLPSDASKRRYFRLPSALLMDAPPPHEDTARFQLIADILQGAGLTVPQIYASDHLGGFLLVEDWGHTTYRKAIDDGASETELYEETIDSLVHLHQNLSENTLNLPSYGRSLFLEKVCLFTEWHDEPFSESAKADFKGLWKEAFDNQPKIPHSLAMRDVMVDNLMWLPERRGMNRCGFIDFQDATWTPVCYDIVSLLTDARRDVDPACVQKMLKTYLKAFPHFDEEVFMESYSLWGAQRAIRILGVFYRLAKQDGKKQYMDYVPRLWRHLEECLSNPSLKGIREWFRKVAAV